MMKNFHPHDSRLIPTSASNRSTRMKTPIGSLCPVGPEEEPIP